MWYRLPWHFPSHQGCPLPWSCLPGHSWLHQNSTWWMPCSGISCLESHPSSLPCPLHYRAFLFPRSRLRHLVFPCPVLQWTVLVARSHQKFQSNASGRPPARFLGAPAAGKIRDATLRGSNPRARRSNIQQLLGEKRHRSSLRAVLRLLAGRATLLAGSRAGAVAGGLVGGAERTGLESVAGATEPTRSSRGGQLKRPEYRKKAASAANRTKAIQIILRCFKLPSLFAFNLVLTNLVPASDSEFSLVGCGVL